MYPHLCLYPFIPPIYFFGDSEKRDINRDDVRWDAMIKLGELIQTKKKREMKSKWNWKRLHFHLISRRLIWVIIFNVQKYRCRLMSLWKWLADITTWSLARQIPVLFPSESSHSKQANKYVIPCIVLLASFRIIFIKHLHKPNPPSHGPVIWFKISFVKVILLPNFNEP